MTLSCNINLQDDPFFNFLMSIWEIMLTIYKCIAPVLSIIIN